MERENIVDSNNHSDQPSSSHPEDTAPIKVQQPVTLPFARCATLLAKLAKSWFDSNENSPIEVSQPDSIYL